MSIRLRIGAVRGSNVSADHLLSGQDAANSDTDAYDIPVPEENPFRPSQSYPGCFGLPYQDHNYGAPPPMSPPPPPKSPSPPPPTVSGPAEVEEDVKVPVVSNEEEVVEDSITRCICGFLHDDGYMICCDKCSVWQHIDCMEIDRNNIPDSYYCEICKPRELDFERARMIQLRRKEEIDTSATDTDPEEPANALASLGRKPVQPKPKGSKQRRVSKAGARLLKTGRLTKSPQLKRDKKLKLTKKEKENMKDALKKQKIGKTGVPKEKKIKKKLNTSLSQNKADFWDFLNEPLCPVNDVKENEYSPEIVEFLSHVKTNGVHSPHSIGVFPEELLVQLYKVSEVKKNRKGLEAIDLIVPGKAVIEFKGRVMLRQHYLPDPHLNQSQPYVLYYSKLEGLDLCIDASAFGGDARFIRRSCTPNAEMCHIIDNGNLHFIVQAKKEIAKGTEITIPFDFNYQESPTCVECACGRVSCPVAKFWKKVKLAQKSPEKTKRKRQASGEGRVRRNSQGKSSPVKVPSGGNKSPLKYSPTKNSTAVPLVLSLNESSEAVDVTAPVDNELDFASMAKPAPTPRRSSRAISDVKEEREVKPSRLAQCKESWKVAPGQENTPDCDSHHAAAAESSFPPASESEADSAGECHRKLTREERKMEAIMKAFEKMEKREERRKEALARMDKKHVDHIKEEPVDKGHILEACSGNSMDVGMDNVVEQPSQSTVNTTTTLSPEADEKVVVKQEDPTTAVVDSPQKSVSRHKRIKRKRRNSRVMSAIEPLFSSPSPKPQVASSTEMLQSVGVAEEVKEEPVEIPPISTNMPSTLLADPLPSSVEEVPPYAFLKKRKYLFNDSVGSRSPEGPVGEEEMFVSCTPGPRSSMEHIQRRNSTSATYGRISDSAKGNAKKRWLRQAMYETVPLTVETEVVSLRSSSTGSSSPPILNTPATGPGPSATVTSATMSSLHSPNCSPSDFVTPFKKRRLAPEFLPSQPHGQATPPISEESSYVVTSPNHAESTATSSSIMSPAVDQTMPPDNVRILPSQETRPRMKGTCLFGRKNVNGLVVHSGSAHSACDGPGPGSSASTAPTSTQSLLFDSLLGQLSMDLLSTSCSHQTGGFVSAGSSASSTVGNTADSAEATSDGSYDSPGATASSSSAACVIRHLEPGVEVPLVDSSDAALDTGLVRKSPQGAGNGDSLGVCSSNNEVSTVCVNSADSDGQEERCFRQDEVVAESSCVASSGRTYPLQDQDEDVSESQPMADRIEVEDEGNEASGSVSVSEELSRHSENVSCTVPQPPSDCQVNSSQDLLSCHRMAAGPCSPSQGEAECRLSSHSVLVVDRTEDSRSVSADGSERPGVSSALDSSVVERTRTGVSSAKDSVSSVMSESMGSSDMECGPSSSTQTSHSRPGDTFEIMLCNSSDVGMSGLISFAYEESDVDSTTQSGRVVRVDLNQCDTADSHLQAMESEESCCDSNCDEKAELGVVCEGGNVSSSGPADSQGDDGVDNGQGGMSTSSGVVSCSTASVSSTHYSTSQTDLTLSTSVSSSVYSSLHLDSAQGRQMSNMMASTSSSLSTAECADLAGPSQSTSHHAHPLATSVFNAETASAASAPESDSIDVDGADTSERPSNSPFPAAELCEASTSSTDERRLSEDGDSSTRPVSSSRMQQQNDMDLPVSSADAAEDRVVVNGDQLHAGMVSSFSEDSFGSSATNPSATVSSSEAQAAPAAKRKVSLSEYRNRRKDKTGCAASTSSATSPKSSSDHHALTSRGLADHCISLAPLPLFEPISIRENRDYKDEKERREKPMSLSDRLRIEFGLETSEEEEKANSTGPKKSRDIPPPPPPLPRSGKVGGVGVRRPGSVGGPRTVSTENDEEGQPASSSTGNTSPSATVTTTGGGVGFSSSRTPGQTALSSWFVKLHHSVHSQAAAGLGDLIVPSSLQQAAPGLGDMVAPSSLQQHSSSSPVFGTGSTSQQRLSQSYHVAGAGGSQLPNGSHPPAPAAFSTSALYAASSSQGQPHPQSFPVSCKQQQTSAPPPPPNTAYPHYLAQSRTQCLRAQTPAVGPRPPSQLGTSVSLSPTPHSAAVTAPVGNGVAPARHTPIVNSSANHSHGRYHFGPFSHNETVGYKGSYASDRKRR